MENVTEKKLNMRLAERLGWTDIFDVGDTLLGTPPGGAPASRGQAAVPDWCGDWHFTGPLMEQFVISIFPDTSHLQRAGPPCSWFAKVERTAVYGWSNEPRIAIVQCVIAKLEGFS